MNFVNVENVLQSAAGISGVNYGKISNCLNNGTIKGIALVGGITGWNEEKADIILCCNNGQVKATGKSVDLFDDDTEGRGFAGGIAGRNVGNISKCINLNLISSVERILGGIAGRNLGEIKYCMNSGNIAGKAVSGGIVGNNRGKIQYSYCENIQVTATDGPSAGGICGNMTTLDSSYIKNTYSIANVKGVNYVGGIVRTSGCWNNNEFL